MTGILESKKGFYVGDCCYALDSETYDIWRNLGFEKGTVAISGIEFFVDYTAWGDGEYKDDEGRTYPVDAGVLSVIPYELLEKQKYWQEEMTITNNNPEDAAYNIGGNFFYGNVCAITTDRGYFTIEIDKHENHIDTRIED